eukprot:GHVU01039261.1.p1 GENE.GHVU01039261.1~~GHVU01039261.1.p1  ORF type:complete len:390 (+),score=25.48 GHVU01039261.1:1-1170(+)
MCCPYDDISATEWAEIRRLRVSLLPGQHRYLRSSLYGDRRSPFLFHRHLRTQLDGIGFREIAESLFIKGAPSVPPSFAMAGHVDDFALAGGEQELPKEAARVGGVIELKAPTNITLDTPHDFLGMQLTRHADSIYLSHDRYLESLDLEGTRAKRVCVRDIVPAEEHEVDEGLVSKFRARNGQLGWAVKLRPKQAVFHSLFSKFATAPSNKLLLLLMRVLAALKTNPSPLIMRPIRGNPRLVCYSDAAYKMSDMSSRLGYIIYLRGEEDDDDCDVNAIAWATKSVKEKLDSSTSAELMGLKLVIKTVWEYVPVIQSLFGIEPLINILIDSRPLYDQIRFGRCRSEPKMNKHLEYVLQEMEALNAKVEWIPRAKQWADALTKPIWPEGSSS